MDPVVIEMRRRVRMHFVMTIGGILFAFVASAVVGGIASAALGERGASIGGLLAAGCILLIPVIGFYSTFTNLRCPSCNGLVAWQVSQKYSAFGALAGNQCRKCGATIFQPRGGSRVALVIAVVAVGVFLVAAGMAGFLAQSARPASQPPASSGP